VCRSALSKYENLGLDDCLPTVCDHLCLISLAERYVGVQMEVRCLCLRNCQNVVLVLRWRLRVCVDAHYQNVCTRMEVTCMFPREVSRVVMSGNFSASSCRVDQGEGMHICLFAWCRSGIIQRIWTIHLGGGGGEVCSLESRLGDWLR
jgi:hypothetical protein